MQRAAEELRTAGLIAGRHFTNAGRAVLEKLVAARRAHLTEVLAQWAPGERPELADLLRRLVNEAVPNVQPGDEVVV